VTTFQAEFAKALGGGSAPFLFVGSGFARRYAGLNDWAGLLRRFAQETPQPYEYYVATAGGRGLPAVATEIAAAFHQIWWDDPKFAASRAANARFAIDQESALKIEVANSFASAVLTKKRLLRSELTLLSNAQIDGVVTTNYDRLLEEIFPSFTAFVGQDSMLFQNPQGIGEIYKIHGSCEDPTTLILTSNDYQHFDDRSPYLAAKLLAMFVEHPVIFVGYSVSDRNILAILKSIAECLSPTHLAKLRDRLIFVQWDARSTSRVTPYEIAFDGYAVPAWKVTVPDYSEVFSILGDLQRAFPARVLRQLKEHVYELVRTTTPTGRLAVVGLEDDDGSSELQIVYGVGVVEQLAARGYSGLTRWDIINDVLDDGPLDANTLIGGALTTALKASNTNIPVYKYLFNGGHLDEAGVIVNPTLLPANVLAMAAKEASVIKSSAFHQSKSELFLAQFTDFDDLVDRAASTDVFNYAMFLDHSKIDRQSLWEFLIRNREDLDSWTTTQYPKLVCLFDWLTYGPPAMVSPAKKVTAQTSASPET
jgi:hypothetical protein